jgi:hypothetical protein
LCSECKEVFQTESSTKYLGVTIPSDLKWNKRIDIISSTASKHLNFIKRNLKVNEFKVSERESNVDGVRIYDA